MNLGHQINLGEGNHQAEKNRRIRISWVAICRLGYVLKDPHISIYLKIIVFDSCVLPVITHRMEITTLTAKAVNRLRTTQLAIERTMLGITLRDRIRNEEIRRRMKV